MKPLLIDFASLKTWNFSFYLPQNLKPLILSPLKIWNPSFYPTKNLKPPKIKYTLGYSLQTVKPLILPPQNIELGRPWLQIIMKSFSNLSTGNIKDKTWLTRFLDIRVGFLKKMLFMLFQYGLEPVLIQRILISFEAILKSPLFWLNKIWQNIWQLSRIRCFPSIC